MKKRILRSFLSLVCCTAIALGKVELTAVPFPFFDNGISYFANYLAVNGDFEGDGLRREP